MNGPTILQPVVPKVETAPRSGISSSLALRRLVKLQLLEYDGFLIVIRFWKLIILGGRVRRVADDSVQAKIKLSKLETTAIPGADSPMLVRV